MSALYTTPIAKIRFSSERFPEALKGLMEERHLSYRQLAYHFAINQVAMVLKGGRIVSTLQPA